MQDRKKTKTQKTSEVSKLHQRSADLEASEIERKGAVEALHSEYEQIKMREMLYRTLVDNMDLGISFIDADHTILMASAAQGKQFNIPTMSDCIGTKCFRAFERRKTVCPHCPGVQAMATGQPAEVETEGVRTDGSRFHVRLQAFPVFGDDGTVTGFIEISENITDRKRVEKALRENAELYCFITDISMDGFAKIHLDGRILDVNEAYCQMLGYSKEELLKMTVADIEALATPDEIKKQAKEIMEVGVGRFETRHRRKDECTIDVEVSMTLLRQSGHILVFLRDITERKRAEEELRESEEHYRQLIEISPEAIIVQHNKKIVLANTAAARLVGAATFEQVKGKPIEYFVHPHYRKAVNNRIRRVIDKQTVVPFIEQKFIRLDGRIINVEVAATPFSYQSKPAVQIVVRDISERKQAEEHRKESFQRLKRSLEETVSSLASTIEKRDAATAGHQKRVANLACAIAEEMGFSGDQIDGIRMVGLIHDIGKIYVPSDILNTSRRLTEPELEMFKSHCQVGYEILKTIDFPWPIAPVVLQHHERQDGSGYPQGLCGEDIIFEARILAVADVIEAMSNHRPYRPAYSIGDALEEILHHKDSLYDPEVVDACLRVFYDKGFTFAEDEKEK